MKTTIFGSALIGQQLHCSTLIFSHCDSSVEDSLAQFLKYVLCPENLLELSKTGSTEKEQLTLPSGVD